MKTDLYWEIVQKSIQNQPKDQSCSCGVQIYDKFPCEKIIFYAVAIVFPEKLT